MKEADIKLSETVFEPQAKRRVSLGLLMDAIVIEQKIVAGEDQVRAWSMSSPRATKTRPKWSAGTTRMPSA
jgi:FKBP-type peptidyl-prolyl cis-trans isomerase (trigger factor)